MRSRGLRRPRSIVVVGVAQSRVAESRVAEARVAVAAVILVRIIVGGERQHVRVLVGVARIVHHRGVRVRRQYVARGVRRGRRPDYSQCGQHADYYLQTRR